jgi:hypothetical protein
MIICRHFRLPEESLSGCEIGRIAALYCGKKCSAYDQDGAPSRRSDREHQAWLEMSNDIEDCDEHAD